MKFIHECSNMKCDKIIEFDYLESESLTSFSPRPSSLKISKLVMADQ